MKIHLLVIDAQYDFCNPAGSLFVSGADQDMTRLGKMIDRLQPKINQIHATLDSHHYVQIFHPIFWVNSKGEHPTPFTLISEDDVNVGVWTTTNPSCRQRGVDYVKALKQGGRYALCIWPYHTIISTLGATIVDPVSSALKRWCMERFKKVDYQVKGSNPFTEHYSVFQADVVDSSDPSTMLNTELITTIQQADEIVVAGEALSHCVCNSISDLINQIGSDSAKKFVLLTDAMSNVTGFEKLGNDFLDKMKKMGMKTSTTVDYLS
jgi:nicotinamidase-related amidase